MRKRTFKKATAYTLSAAMVLSVCAVPGAKAGAATKKATVKLNKTSVSVTVGGKVKLKVQKSKVKKIKKVKWSVKDKKIASISGGGTNWVKGRKNYSYCQGYICA